MPIGDIMQRAQRAAERPDDYFVIVKRVRHRSILTRWTWEIRRRSKPLGVTFDGDDYTTPQEARLAGEKALSDFLNNLQD